MKKVCPGLLLCGLLTTGFASYSTEEVVQRPRKPPKEAIEACNNKSENETVSFTGRFGEALSATCQYIDEILTAVPEQHRRDRKKQQ